MYNSVDGGMNALKHHLNAEKQSRHENPNHLEPISSYEEELQIPMSSVPITVMLPSPDTGPSVDTPADTMFSTPSPADLEPMILVHIPTAHLSVDSILGTGPHTQPHLTTAEWSSLISKAQMGEVPIATGDLLADPMAAPASMVAASPHAKIFTADAMTFPLHMEPGALPDCLIQMALNHVFIPFSMLMTVTL